MFQIYYLKKGSQPLLELLSTSDSFSYGYILA